MRKVTVLFLTGLMAIAAVVGCSSEASGPSGTASEIADKGFEQSGVEPFGMADVIDDDDKMNWYLGSTNYPELAESAVVLPMISLDTRSLYILKANAESDVAGMLTHLKEDIDPNKLVCISFSHEDVVIESRGDVIFMTINSNVEQREALVTAFAGIE